LLSAILTISASLFNLIPTDGLAGSHTSLVKHTVLFIPEITAFIQLIDEVFALRLLVIVLAQALLDVAGYFVAWVLRIYRRAVEDEGSHGNIKESNRAEW
jgi:hypothetical protein